MKNQRMQKLKEMLLNNLALKIIAVLVAILVWVIIVNVSDPSQRVTVTGISAMINFFIIVPF